ncbi:MAG: toprim domain-containing protein [bacterium]|nr:toprim domain-containing protein [bacterium]
MNDFSFIKNILEENNVPYQEFPNYLKCIATWRGGDSISSITIYDNHCIDHVTGENFDYKSLICKILCLDDKEKLEEYLEKSGTILENKSKEISEPLIKNDIKTLDKSFLDKLKHEDSYWFQRGIDIKILRELGGGVYKNRYYFPIYNKKMDLLGLVSRDLTDKQEPRWRIRGKKQNFVYCAFTNSKDIINKKEVILVEGISDLITLMSCDIRNVLCLFGLECSFSICNYLLRIPDVKIKIAVNSDGPGVEASQKIYRKLKKYFDSYNISINLPKETKDWNDCLTNHGKNSILAQLK